MRLISHGAINEAGGGKAGFLRSARPIAMNSRDDDAAVSAAVSAVPAVAPGVRSGASWLAPRKGMFRRRQLSSVSSAAPGRSASVDADMLVAGGDPSSHHSSSQYSSHAAGAINDASGGSSLASVHIASGASSAASSNALMRSGMLGTRPLSSAGPNDDDDDDDDNDDDLGEDSFLFVGVYGASGAHHK